MNTKKQNNKLISKTIYSLRIKAALREKGIEPLVEHDNPYKERFKCWVYALTPEFEKAFNEIMAEGGKIYG